jgi:hypothetical protein
MVDSMKWRGRKRKSAASEAGAAMPKAKIARISQVQVAEDGQDLGAPKPSAKTARRGKGPEPRRRPRHRRRMGLHWNLGEPQCAHMVTVDKECDNGAWDKAEMILQGVLILKWLTNYNRGQWCCSWWFTAFICWLAAGWVRNLLLQVSHSNWGSQCPVSSMCWIAASWLTNLRSHVSHSSLSYILSSSVNGGQ